MKPRDIRALCLRADPELALAELRRRGIGPARLRELLGRPDQAEWQAWSGAAELYDEQGRRTEMAVHVPPYAPGRRLGALIVLHGAGGSGDQVLPSFTALGDRLSMAVLCPTAQIPTRKSNNLDLAGIFGSRFHMPRWDLAGRDFPLAALRWARTELDVDPDRCVLAGVSMGGLATWNLAMRFWHSYAAAVPLNGALSVWESFGTDARTQALLPNTLPLPLYVVHGAEDEQIPAQFDRESVSTLRALGHPDVAYEEVPNGAHGLETLGLAEDGPLFHRLAGWLANRTRRTGQSDEIRHRAEEDAHGRAHWVSLGGITPQQAAVVHARRTLPDRIDIEVSGAHQVTLHLSGERIAPGDTITVAVNGAVTTVRFAPDLATVLRSYRETADPRLVAEQVVNFDVPHNPSAGTDSEPTGSSNEERCGHAQSI
ncbi:hypothetical protein MOV08_24685 [Streptomyces yunnanensis]|uniref:Dienelactone hydrolase domain-containing protein n=1 Tax=Streptomyces yunnanensis TaxID=156453 RepID=A0ABY8ADZ7_9ACTN|nr:hypothetical protein [Streptomyces yunnanensis]WEB42135.1 hypothetical protein MOV08_24685 [Streptomyces yunnanensis]